MRRFARVALVAGAVLACAGAGVAAAQTQYNTPTQQGEDPASPFLGGNPSSVPAQGGKSYYQKKQESPNEAVRCDAFNRIGRGFDECRARQMNQAFQQEQQQQSGTPQNPRLQPVDPLAKTRPYR